MKILNQAEISMAIMNEPSCGRGSDWGKKYGDLLLTLEVEAALKAQAKVTASEILGSLREPVSKMLLKSLKVNFFMLVKQYGLSKEL